MKTIRGIKFGGLQQKLFNLMLIFIVLLIGSADDRVLGADATAQIAERLDGRPDFELYMYDGYGHAAYDTAPDYKERVLGFLAQGSSD